MNKVKQHRSKYNFGNLKEVGESMFVDPEDVYSALQSLNAFNRRHGSKIVLTPEGESDFMGRIKLTVTSI